MATIASAHPRLWLAVSHVPDRLADRRATLTRIEAMLSERYVLKDTRELRGITLRRYDRTRC